ncbi:bile acid:sodium symporter family protein [Cyanobacterium stanieri LEGE 03274]|uniref:Bile acid:sodium symporter family protein n=1 Tax=Cyanobacterium stanieri LEGE 03274 TaxID=1828756 RepID=A0ABR9V736_9CHRO|nr:bile acid:sodium symporter family protein [Cyanobacterium stanieri]MBE9223709.1 bile acid:sodium symporter family protein [Cyanobacterium stanieri LEGE 03274]
MEANFVTEIFLPIALITIMLGMGLTLTPKDFQRIIIDPKAIFTGLFCQLIVLPIIAFLLMRFWNLEPEFAVGVILLSACPGGATSNLYSYLGKCDTALSISLTALSSIITIISLPFIVNYGMEVFMGDRTYVALPVLQTIVQIIVVTLIPVSLGMLIRSYKPNFALRADKPVKIASGLFMVLVVLGAILAERENLIPFIQATGFPTITLNVITLLVSFLIAKTTGLNFKQSSTISIEAGMQNGTLAIAIATSATLLNNPQIAIPPAIYSIIMFVTGAMVSYIFSRINGEDKKLNRV